MRAYVIRRLLLVIPTVLVVSVVIFYLVDFLPGDIISAMRTADFGSTLDMSAIEEALGLNAPALTRYGRWLGVAPQADGEFSGILQGELGLSWWRRMPVLELLSTKWPVTLELGLLALAISQIIALPIGIYSALRQDTWGDYLGRTFAILCISVPGFWLGTMVMVLPAIWWGYMPPIMLIPFTEDPIANLRMFIIPATILAMAMGGMVMRMTRTMMLEVLRQDYVRTAWAKGLRERVVVMRHAVKNALIPVVSLIGLQLPILVGGSVIMENIFNLPGLGRLLLVALEDRDYPVVSGVNLFFATAVVLFNLLIDLIYPLLDPRVRYE
jgi:peptide/nickel transport system permease protein